MSEKFVAILARGGGGVRRLIGVTMWQATKDILPFILISLLTMAVAGAAALPFVSVYARLAVKILVAVLLYALLMRSLHVVVFTESVEFLLSRIRQKR